MNNNTSNNGNLMAAILLSVLVLVGYHFMFERPRLEALRAQQAQQATLVAKPAALGAPAAPAVTNLRERGQIIADGFAQKERVRISTDRLHGSLNLRGGRVDDLTLATYRETVEDTSPEVTLLSPSGTALPGHAYFAEFGWLADKTDVPLPNADTLWRTTAKELTVEKPVTLTWDNGKGLLFTREIAIDANYMFTITDRVTSAGAVTATLFNYGAVSRHAAPPAQDLFILHEGPVGVFDEILHESTYSDLLDEDVNKATTTGGWAGITDKYWLVALVPDQAQPAAVRMHGAADAGSAEHEGQFQVDARGPGLTLAAGGTVTSTTRLFAGAKEVRLLDAYEKDLGILRFDLAVDFGWFYFLTKPFFHALDGIARATADTGYGFAIAILLFTVFLKLLFFPLQNKSYKAMNRMKLLQPKMLELRERFKDDRQKLSMEMFELYKREKVNPMAGCWPILLQIPVFFALYKVLYVSIEMRHAPFWGWVHDLAAPDPSTVLNLFGLLPFTPPGFLAIGIWPILMGITMYLQQKLAPTAPDPTQAAIFRWLPVVFTFMLAHFPAGLVIYWTWSNSLSILQQWILLKRHK